MAHCFAYFYAESWVLVHFLIYGPDTEGGKKLDRFFALLQHGMEQKKAFRQAFGDPSKTDRQNELSWDEVS
jgi:hypothetical protein